MAVDLRALLKDWHDESWALESVLRPIGPRDWDRPTPAPGWGIRHQVAHLAWTDEALFLALTAPEEFGRLRLRVGADPEAAVAEAAEAGAGADPEVIVRRWVAGQRRTAQALGRLDPGARIDWFGPPMGAAAAVSARIMETFAHGQDVRDALGLAPVRSPRLRHIAHLAVAARPYSFAVNSLPAPVEDIRVELASDGETWSWGPDDAAQKVVGDALDFALLATRRRHRDDCAVQASGNLADQWLDIIQAYAGPPGEGRQPGAHQAPAGPEVDARG
ncbi:TIGR03084 family metal-binding protein [Arthrobacter ginkgonis]|uniref:TIGR03084 family metal-binding protein n=1 Tax=Arthrobacter ginkgonis TaxID=1630594 RepID=A0ABP7C5P7_9MICC